MEGPYISVYQKPQFSFLKLMLLFVFCALNINRHVRSPTFQSDDTNPTVNMTRGNGYKRVWSDFIFMSTRPRSMINLA